MGEKVQLVASSLRAKRTVGKKAQLSDISGGCLRDWFLSHLTLGVDRESAYFGGSGATDNKRELSNLLQHQRTSPPQVEAGTTWHNKEKVPSSPILPWEGKRRMECACNVPAFQRAACGTGFCLALLRVLTGPAYFGCLRAAENKGELNRVVPENLNYHR